MLRNYFKIAWRNIWKNLSFSAINIFGLTVGLTCCLFMMLYIKNELSYDDFQRNGDRIARVIMEYSFSGTVKKGNWTSTKVAPVFSRTFPEVEAAARMTLATRVVKHDENMFTEKKFMFADSTFFTLFYYQMLSGDAATALNGPRKVVLTESSARKYFGSEDPLGKTIKAGSDGTDYTVTGVMKDYPQNSQMKFDFLASFSSLDANQEETYWNANYTTFLLLKDPLAFKTLQQKIPAFMKNEMARDLTGNDYVSFWLEPFSSIHLHSEYDGFEPNNSITYIYIIAAVAFLMLLIACFTYINLSTARAVERAREVGVRKVVGALKKQIFWQFISESLIITLMALLLSGILVYLLLPFFSHLAGEHIPASAIVAPQIIAFAIFVVVVISLAAGSYPALILSRYQPVKVLKGSFKNTSSGIWLRRSLIVFQFTISVFLIVSTLIIKSQLNYLQNKKLGYDREHILVMPLDGKAQQKISTLKSVLKSNPDVKHVTTMAQSIANIVGGYSMRNEAMPEDAQLMVTANPVDEEFVQTTGIQLIAGSDFTGQDVKDVEKERQEEKMYHYLINEAAAKELGWTPEEAVGKKMFLGNHRPGYVRGVVRNFHFTSLHQPIGPLVLFNEEWKSTMLVKVSGQNMQNTIAFLQSSWKDIVPHRPFEYSFLDEDYANLYRGEMQLGKLLSIFTAIAIFLACLGLFGLSAYVMNQRTKEIGIRKVLGASVSTIVSILSVDFLKLVFAAILVALPIGGWIMSGWLQDFAYRIDMGWWIFAVAALAAGAVTMITVAFQAVRAALANPVKNLRSE